MVRTKLGIIGAVLAAALLISACGADKQGQRDKIAVINWQQAVAGHPQYAKLEQGEKILRDLVQKRTSQEQLAQAQLSSVNKLRGLRQLSQQSYLNADFNTHMAELQSVENERLQKFIAETEAEADAYLEPRTKEAENAYQLKLFNLRALLESVRMKPDERKAVEAEIQQLQRERGDKIGQLRQEKQAYVEAKVRPYMEQRRAHMAQAASQYEAKLRSQVQDSDTRDEELLQEAPKALANALQIMDREIDKQQQKNDSLKQQINQDIENLAVKLAHERGYTIVFNQFKVNLKADDITEAIVQDLKKNK